MIQTCRCLNCIIPPHLLRKLLESDNKEVRQAALNTLLGTARLRGQRSLRATFGIGLSAAPTDGRRSIFDCQNSNWLPGAVLVRTEQGEESADISVNRAFDGLGATREFYREVLDRNSIDDQGMRLDGYVHYGAGYNNAFWDGQQMVFGDGDGVMFTDFTSSLDVIGHELTHGVTEHVAGLEYHKQSGALNESMSDVFGSLVKQWSLGQTAEQADWLIGAEVFTPGIEADALRSMKAPGTAYDNETFGKDPQPDHMSKFVHLPDTEEGDYGGVHINSGIPNKAFYLTATAIGGYAWEAPALIWYEALKASGPTTEFQEFADKTYLMAGELYGTDSMEQQAVLAGWREVGIRISGLPVRPRRGRGRAIIASAGAGHEGDTLTALARQIEAVSSQVTALAKEVSTLKGKRMPTEPGLSSSRPGNSRSPRSANS
ncbi:M4 family metallopeptidase [Microvirga sp. VF16]|uniref:M4 family metallopeptidase n=1 Tax=Microvirga sp. VF16 TaxID=2807101 RepID=UPI00193DC5DD|nr:M4 family metallopeptidase [Microvirga sp. VF16]QRM32007.1 M4 family metallopeptidase [Microvirga sp. VF16]